MHYSQKNLFFRVSLNSSAQNLLSQFIEEIWDTKKSHRCIRLTFHLYLQSKLNCEVLHDDLAFEVRWAVAGESIVIQLVAKLGEFDLLLFILLLCIFFERIALRNWFLVKIEARERANGINVLNSHTLCKTFNSPPKIKIYKVFN